MAVTTKVKALATAALALLERPGDLAVWMDVAVELERAGKVDQHKAALCALGTASSERGHVALAVACALKLETIDSKGAKQLIDMIVKTHARGSSRIEKGARPRPPGPPKPASEEPAPDIASLADASKAAKQAVEAAIKHADERKTDKLPATPLVGVLEADDLRDLISMMKLEERKQGDVLVDVGKPAKSLYWVACGIAEVSRDEHVLGEVAGNSFFGEIALVGGTTRTARVTAATDMWILKMAVESVETIASRAPKLAKVLAGYARSRLLANVMRTSELFSRLNDDERRELLPKFVTLLFEPGVKMIAAGEINDSLFVVASGRCEVRHMDKVLATLTVGDGVGEMSLLSRRPAVADVVAIEKTVMLTLQREQFDKIADRHPGLLAEVYKLLVQREQANQVAIIHDASDLII